MVLDLVDCREERPARVAWMTSDVRHDGLGYRESTHAFGCRGLELQTTAKVDGVVCLLISKHKIS